MQIKTFIKLFRLIAGVAPAFMESHRVDTTAFSSWCMLVNPHYHSQVLDRRITLLRRARLFIFRQILLNPIPIVSLYLNVYAPFIYNYSKVQ